MIDDWHDSWEGLARDALSLLRVWDEDHFWDTTLKAKNYVMNPNLVALKKRFERLDEA